jgi:hypothetical protein
MGQRRYYETKLCGLLFQTVECPPRTHTGVVAAPPLVLQLLVEHELELHSRQLPSQEVAPELLESRFEGHLLFANTHLLWLSAAKLLRKVSNVPD